MESHNHLFPPATPEMSQKRASLAPETREAFRAFNKQVFAEGALDEKTKQLLAVAVALDAMGELDGLTTDGAEKASNS